MPVQELLGKIASYNAAIELPHAGMVGLSALGEHHTELADRELSACVDLCARGIRAIDDDPTLRKDDVYVYLAFRELLAGQQREQDLRDLLGRIKDALRRALEGLRGTGQPLPPAQDLAQVEADLREIADRVKRMIPRDAYMASLVGTTFPGIAIRR